MELRVGFKQTEVGCIPDEWGVAYLRDVTHVITCGLAATPTYVPESQGKPFLSAQNVRDGQVVFEGYKFIAPRLFEQITRHNKPQCGDILYTRVGAGIGDAGIVESDSAFGIYVSLTLIKPNSKRLHNRFAVYLLNSPSYRMLAKNGQLAGGGVQNLNVEVVRKFQIPLPSLKEQQSISAVLSDVDALIAGLEKLIAKKRDLKQAAMQQLLTGQTRLPGFSGEWAVKRLGDVGECLRGVSYKGDADLFSHDTDRSKRLLRSNNVQESLVVTSDLQYVKVDRVREHQILREGDVLICMANGSKALVGKAAYFEINDGFEYTFGAFMGAYRGNEQANHRFVFYLFQTGRYRDYIANLLAGSSINNLSPSSIESLEFKFPELSEQEAISQALTDMDSELIAIESRLTKTRELKQGMMQELLTGRTRLV